MATTANTCETNSTRIRDIDPSKIDTGFHELLHLAVAQDDKDSIHYIDLASKQMIKTVKKHPFESPKNVITLESERLTHFRIKVLEKGVSIRFMAELLKTITTIRNPEIKEYDRLAIVKDRRLDHSVLQLQGVIKKAESLLVELREGLNQINQLQR